MNELHTDLKEKKLLTHARLQTAVLVCIFALLLLAAVFMAAQVSALKSEIGAVLENFDPEQMNRAVNSLKDAANALNDLDLAQFNDTVGALKGAAEQLNGVDVEKLNGAVSALKDAAGNLGDVDVQSLNSLVGSLETAAGKLQNAVNAITGIFSR